MNKRINYRYQNVFTGSESELDSIVTDGIIDFEDWLRDQIPGNYAIEHEDGSAEFYILDGCNEQTGDLYIVVSTSDTDEQLRG